LSLGHRYTQGKSVVLGLEFVETSFGLDDLRAEFFLSLFGSSLGKSPRARMEGDYCIACAQLAELGPHPTQFLLDRFADGIRNGTIRIVDVLYGAADAEETFLLDFFIGSMARDHEAYGKYGHPDLTGTALTPYGKHHKTRTVEINRRLADAIRERRKRSNSKALFVKPQREPDKHLLRKLQNIAKKAGAGFHTELHKLRKTGASRHYLAGVPLPTLMLELGRESLAVTQYG
jgi:Phage integrase family